MQLEFFLLWFSVKKINNNNPIFYSTNVINSVICYGKNMTSMKAWILLTALKKTAYSWKTSVVIITIRHLYHPDVPLKVGEL